IVHRDIKPANIMVTPDGEPVILDFGLARDQGSSAEQLTLSGEVLGSPAYMSPEQVSSSSDDLDRRTDVYSLGVVLYECLTLRRPFEHATREGLYQKIRMETAVDPRKLNPDVDRDLSVVIEKAMEKDRERRYSSALAFAEDLRRVREFEPIHARPAGAILRARRWVQRKPALTSVLLALATAAGALWYAQRQTSITREAKLQAAAIAKLEEEAYSYLKSRPHNLASLEKVVDRLALFPQRSAHFTELQETLRKLTVVSRSEAGCLDAEARIRRIDAALKDGSMTEASIAEEYALALQELNEAAYATPDMSLDSSFRKANEFKAEWVRHKATAKSDAGKQSIVDAGAADLVVDGPRAGGAAYLFRFEEQTALVAGGEARLVPVPVRLASDDAASGSPRVLERVSTPVCPGALLLRVDSVAAGSSAELNGIRRGDFVAALGGEPVGDRIFVLPGATLRPDLAPLTPVTRIAGREIRDELDVEVVCALTNPGDELLAQIHAPGSSSRDVRVRRYAAGLTPALGSALRVLEGTLPDGGIDILVCTGNETRSVHLAGPVSGLALSWTAGALFASEANRIGTVPFAARALPPGSYLLLVRQEGSEDLRLPFQLEAGHEEILWAELFAEGTTPPGFVRIAAGSFASGAREFRENGGDPYPTYPPETLWLDDFWISRTQVTVGEYLEYLNDVLNDPVLGEELEQGMEIGTYARIPRSSFIDRVDRPTCNPVWERVGNRFVTTWDPKRPITDITCHDADAYCLWITQRARARGSEWSFRLPTEHEWEKAARGADGRNSPWGGPSQPRFSCWESGTDPEVQRLEMKYWELACESTARATRDESPFGVFRTAGTILEWCCGGMSHLNIPFRRPWRGGFNAPEDVRTPLRQDGNPDRPGHHDSFRLVAWKPGRGR
ncbi:MAG TPA: SUMF1/EgtB/PvdO family nonheme iron enzyme, partial [Planctomycetota bacterium]|nr:SUMF1/EgtB/PvdO family nonheme iron enzyme [Planctomycetota bacterium]